MGEVALEAVEVEEAEVTVVDRGEMQAARLRQLTL